MLLQNEALLNDGIDAQTRDGSFVESCSIQNLLEIWSRLPLVTLYR